MKNKIIKMQSKKLLSRGDKLDRIKYFREVIKQNFYRKQNYIKWKKTKEKN